MIETNKTLSTEQVKALRKLATDEEIEKFFIKLNYNYGGGEVLDFTKIESFFFNGLHKNVNTDILTLFIDTVRILRLMDRDENEVIGLDSASVMILHDKLSSEYVGTVDAVKAIEYEKAVSPFNSLTGNYNFNSSDGNYSRVKIELIRSLKELNHEGSRMQHCIATYDDIIIRKQYVGFRVYNKNNGERLTLGCYRMPNSNELIFNQLKGVGNSPAKKDSCLSIINFCNEKDIKIPDSEIFDLLPALSNN